MRYFRFFIFALGAPLLVWPQGYPDPRSPLSLPGSKPQTIASADLNRDGMLDLIVTDWGADRVHVLLASGGGFVPAPGGPYDVGLDPLGLVLVDVNRDGKLDLVCSSWSSSTMSVLLGDGSGRFTLAPGSPIAIGDQLLLSSVADVNGDTLLDYIVSRYGDNSLTVMFGDGRGWSASRTTYPVGARPLTNAVADFDRDGYLDIAVACLNDDTIHVLRGSPSGAFTPLLILAAPSGPAGLVARDLNGDGTADIAVTGRFSNDLTIFRGNGAGGFTRMAPIATGAAPGPIAVADFTGDGLLDVAIPDHLGNTVTLLRGDGRGGYSPAPSSPFVVGVGPTHVDPGDVDGDGRPDMLVATHFDASVTLLLARAQDRTPPVITYVGRTAPNAQGWNRTDVVLTWRCTDTGSGVPSELITRTVSAEGANQSVTATCIDNAGNVSAPDMRGGINIDKTPPVLAVSSTLTVDATTPAGAGVNYLASVRANDNLTASLAVSCNPAQGVFSIGSTTVNCTATDLASNVSAASFSVVVRGASTQIANLSARLGSFNLGPKDQGLSAKVAGAASAVASGNTANACAQLAAFINQVQAKSGKDLTPAQAATLITDASRIRSVIGCSP